MGGQVATLQSRVADGAFRRDGYVVVPLDSPDGLARSLGAFERFPSGIDSGSHVSMHSADNDYKARVDHELTEALWPALQSILPHHRPLVGAFTVKGAEGPSVVPLHQDWNTIEEGETAGLTCWIPLTEIGAAEGRMQVVPGSHRYMGGLRGSPGFPASYQQISDRIRDELTVTLEIGVGEAMIMDARVLHTTGQNMSGKVRVACYLSAVPVGVPTLHYYMPRPGIVECYRVDREFFTTFNIGERPPGEPFATIEGYDVPQLTMEDMLERAAAASRSEPPRRRRSLWRSRGRARA